VSAIAATIAVGSLISTSFSILRTRNRYVTQSYLQFESMKTINTKNNLEGIVDTKKYQCRLLSKFEDFRQLHAHVCSTPYGTAKVNLPLPYLAHLRRFPDVHVTAFPYLTHLPRFPDSYPFLCPSL
jgi:hypothetical protein